MNKTYLISAIALVIVIALFSIWFLGRDNSKPEGDYNDAQTQEEVKIPKAVKGKYTDLTPMQAKYLIDTDPSLTVIDVSPHYNNGHLPGAIHYYIGDGSLDEAVLNLNKDGKYLVYCHVDSVAIAGAQKLVDAGFKTVYRLEGNYSAWTDAGYPVEK